MTSIIPLQVYFVLTTVRKIPPNWLKPLSVITWVIYIAIFWKIGDPFPIHNPKHGVLSVETCISRVGEYDRNLTIPLNQMLDVRTNAR